MTNSSRLFELLLLLILASLWGSSYLFTKIAVTEIPPLTLIALRVGGASVFLLAILAVRRLSLPRDAATWRRLALLSLFNSTGAWSILAWGQQHVSSGLASVLNSTSPLFVFVITLIFMTGERPALQKLIGAVLGFVGVILIVGVDVLDGLGQSVWGQLACLFGAALYGCAAIYGRRFADLPPVVTAAGTMLCATSILAPAALIVDAPWGLQPSLNALGAVFMLAIPSTGVALLLYFRLLRTLGSMGVASQAYLRAGVGVLLGVVVLGETVPFTLAIGVVAAIGGVLLINSPSATELFSRRRDG